MRSSGFRGFREFHCGFTALRAQGRAQGAPPLASEPIDPEANAESDAVSASKTTTPAASASESTTESDPPVGPASDEGVSSSGEVRESLAFADNATAVALYGDGEQTLRLLERSIGVAVNARGNELELEGAADRVALTRRVLEELYASIERGQSVRNADVRHVIRMVSSQPDVQLSDVYENILTRGSRKVIRAKNLTQRRYVDTIRKHDVAIAIGPAGTGKTYLAMAMAVAALHQKEVSRIILTRPAVEAGERLGFLPGDLSEKVDPYMRPLYDALRDMMDMEKAQRLIERGTIEVAPLAFMRGRTLNDSFVILDEAQNTTSEQMKMFLTRLGENSQAVITGDVTQVDLPKGTLSGLVEARKVLTGVRGIGFQYFEARDVVRHPLVQSIIQAYDRARNEKDEGRG
jgi:phosphate starvation-inducible protein PhoH and related proteins